MVFVKRGILCCIVFLPLIFSIAAWAQSAEDSYEFIQADWHLASISEAHGDWRSACEYYKKVIAESRPLALDVREWYRGTANFGLARCEASLGMDSATVRLSLSRAFEHHFWNFDLILVDSQIVTLCGQAWLDSNRRYWTDACAQEKTMWHDQQPVVFYPSGYDSTNRWPLIIALHGGNENYENFAEHWRSMANTFRAVIAIPAGNLRESQITNSWGSDFNAFQRPIVALAQSLTAKHLVDGSHIYLAGFSQGAQASIELALVRPDLFRGAYAMSGFVNGTITDSMLRIAKKRDVRIYAISGAFEDPTFHSELDSIHQRCINAGIAFELKTIEGMTHEVPLDFHSQMMQAWNWLWPDNPAATVRSVTVRNQEK